MSSFHTILTVSRTLQELLWDGSDAEVRNIIGSQAAIVLTNPSEVQRNPANRLSIWLYQVTENEYEKNQPIARGNGNAGTFPPLALNFFYLITPFTPSGESDQLVLGRLMQTLYDNAILLVRNQPDGDFEELRIVLCRLTLEELTRIWEALREPYRLSVCYQVRVSHIGSLRQTGGARVFDRIGEFSDVPPLAEVGQ